MTNLHVPHEIKVDAVRLRAQGHTVTQVTLTNLQFESVNDGTVYGPCASFVPEKQPSGRRLANDTGWGLCNQNFGGSSHPCLTSDYPECRGFEQGVRGGGSAGASVRVRAIRLYVSELSWKKRRRENVVSRSAWSRTVRWWSAIVAL